MSEFVSQMSLGDVSEEYQAFVDKFKPKRTTDDCITPDNVYEAVLAWVCAVVEGRDALNDFKGVHSVHRHEGRAA